MTTWKARMLDELYLATDAALVGGHEASDGERRSSPGGRRRALGARRARGAARLRGPCPRRRRRGRERAARRRFLAEFLESMPERYVLANAPEAIAAHAELARRYQGEPTAVAVVPSRHTAAAELAWSRWIGLACSPRSPRRWRPPGWRCTARRSTAEGSRAERSPRARQRRPGGRSLLGARSRRRPRGRGPRAAQAGARHRPGARRRDQRHRAGAAPRGRLPQGARRAARAHPGLARRPRLAPAHRHRGAGARPARPALRGQRRPLPARAHHRGRQDQHRGDARRRRVLRERAGRRQGGPGKRSAEVHRRLVEVLEGMEGEGVR